MPASFVPPELTDLALNTLEEEVACWRRIPMQPGWIRLMRFPHLGEIDLSPAGADIPPSEEAVIYHDVPAADAEDLLLRFAMQKVLEAVIGAISVGEPA